NFDVPKWAYVQTLLSMGDRRVSSILSMSHDLAGNWTKALRYSDVNPDFFVYRPKGLDELLPWDFIDHGILKRHLIREYELSLKEEESDICHVGECHRCGVCGEKREFPDGHEVMDNA
ncbi:MAG: radical SAM protein, partial [Thermodesulfobacteriota bacterium]|nr:radical SAM protein [Thermodesulfobacteriota bacterium]